MGIGRPFIIGALVVPNDPYCGHLLKMIWGDMASRHWEMTNKLDDIAKVTQQA